MVGQFRLRYLPPVLCAGLLFLFATSAVAQQTITLLPGIKIDPFGALTREGALTTVEGLAVRDPVGGTLVSFSGMTMRVWVNWDALLNPGPVDHTYAAVLAGGYGWDITSSQSGSMPGMLAFMRDPLMSYVGPQGQRFLLVIAPTFGHMVGAGTSFTGASVGNARISAFAVGVLQALGFDAAHTVLIGFSRGAEATLGAFGRYGDLGCAVAYIAGSYDRGVDTPSVALAEGVRSRARVDLHVCAIGDDWARPAANHYIDLLDQKLRAERSSTSRIAGELMVHACAGHDQSLMEYFPSFRSSIGLGCGSQSFGGPSRRVSLAVQAASSKKRAAAPRKGKRVEALSSR